MSQQFATIPIHRSSVRIIVLLIVGMVEGGSVPAFVLGDEARAIRTTEGITEYELANGLRVLLGPDRSRSTFTVNITYLVGSRHEGVGEKGMAHLLEHMLFKGTRTIPSIWEALTERGGQFNGTTNDDRTNYFETLRATDDNLEFAIRLEADRMVNAKIDQHELDAEMTVVRNEFEIGENNPRGVLLKGLLSTAYFWHNYGNSTIGNRSDIERVPAHNLREFYRAFYRPDNAVLVITGNFDPEKALAFSQQYFGVIPRPEEPLRTTYTIEPPQEGDRHINIRRVTNVSTVGVAYHIPAGWHPDLPVMDVIVSMLTQEPSGTLYRALVEEGLGTRLSGLSFSRAEPATAGLLIDVREGQDSEVVLKRLVEHVESFADMDHSQEDFERARNRRLIDLNIILRDSTRFAQELSEPISWGDWRLLFVYRDRYQEMTLDDVKHVASNYFASTNRTSGMIIPTKESEKTDIPDKPGLAEMMASYRGESLIDQGEEFTATPENIEQRVERLANDQGVRLALLPKKTRGGVVRGELIIGYGTENSLAGCESISAVFPQMMLRGTKNRTYEELKDELDRLGTRLTPVNRLYPGEARFMLETDRDNLKAALQLLSEVIREPAFPEEQLDLVVGEMVTRWEQLLSNPRSRAANTIRRALNPWPRGDVRYFSTTTERIADLRELTAEQLRSFYEENVQAGQLDFAFVGDFDANEVAEAIKAELSEWKYPRNYEPVVYPYQAALAMEKVIVTPGMANAHVNLGTTIALSDTDERFPAMEFAMYMFGSSAASRIMTRLRLQEGMSYATRAMLMPRQQGDHTEMIVIAECAPENVEKAYAAMLEEFQLVTEKGFTDEEIRASLTGYREHVQNRLADDQYLARQLAAGLEKGRTLAFEANLLEKVEDITAEELNRIWRELFAELNLAGVRAGDIEPSTKDSVEVDNE